MPPSHPMKAMLQGRSIMGAMGRRRVLPLIVLAALVAPACSPPRFLRDLIGRRPSAPVSEVEQQAPEAPPPPSAYYLGIIQATYSAGWDSVVKSQGVPGSLIVEVLPGTAAAELGLARGDIITRIDEREIRNKTQVNVSFKSSEDPEHHIVVARVDGTTLGFDVTLRLPGEGSTLTTLESRLAESPDPLYQYLVANSISDFPRAMSLFDAAIAAAPSFGPAHAQKARMIHEESRGKPEEERLAARQLIDQELEKAAELDPDSSELYALSARISLDRGDAISAETDALLAVEGDQLSAEAHHLLGRARMEQARVPESLLDLRLAVDLDAYAVEYYAGLAYCYSLLGRSEDGRLTIEAAKTLTQDEAVLRELDSILETVSGN